MFPNLEAEMARSKIKEKDLAEILGISIKSVRNKLKGTTEFTLAEVKKISKTFDKCTLEYLFIIDSQSA